MLPNGDVLVVESKAPVEHSVRWPKDIIMGWIESISTLGGYIGKSSRITVLRDTNGDGVPEVSSVFLDKLNSPFGVARRSYRSSSDQEPRCKPGRALADGSLVWCRIN